MQKTQIIVIFDLSKKYLKLISSEWQVAHFLFLLNIQIEDVDASYAR